MRLKRLGMSFEAIAEHITSVACGRRRAMVELPANLEFPAGYRITFQAVHKAFRRALARTPAVDVEAHRILDTARCEDLYLALQSGIQKGDPRSVEVGVKVLDHKARLNNLAVRNPATSDENAPISIMQIKNYLLERDPGEASFKVNQTPERLNERQAIEVASSEASDDKPEN